MKLRTFEEFLGEEHMRMFPMVLDDDLPDHFNNWLADLEIDDFLRYGDMFAWDEKVKTIDRCIKIIKGE